MNIPDNSGTINIGTINIGGGTIKTVTSVVGNNPVVINEPASHLEADETADQSERLWDVGVITVLSVEMRAFVDSLGTMGTFAQHMAGDGLRFHEVQVVADRRPFSLVGLQAIGPGETAAMGAFEALRRHYCPPIVVLAGIAGAVHPSLRLGDVVVAQEVVYYDLRKETPKGTRHRGHSQPVPAHIRRAINDFFSTNGEPCSLSNAGPDGSKQAFSIWPGPIGSGSAVIASKFSEIRSYLLNFNDKILAVETEAAGLADAFDQRVACSPRDGWLVIRGVSDKADQDKDDRIHFIAASNAMATLAKMLPHLVPDSRGR